MAGKARVHELAKELGISSKQVLSKLQDLGEYVKSPSVHGRGPRRAPSARVDVGRRLGRRLTSSPRRTSAPGRRPRARSVRRPPAPRCASARRRQRRPRSTATGRPDGPAVRTHPGADRAGAGPSRSAGRLGACRSRPAPTGAQRRRQRLPHRRRRARTVVATAQARVPAASAPARVPLRRCASSPPRPRRRLRSRRHRVPTSRVPGPVSVPATGPRQPARPTSPPMPVRPSSRRVPRRPSPARAPRASATTPSESVPAPRRGRQRRVPARPRAVREAPRRRAAPVRAARGPAVRARPVGGPVRPVAVVRGRLRATCPRARTPA